MYTYNKLYFQYKRFYLRYIKKLIPILNDLHGKKYNQDYWEPIIGLYLRRFLINYFFLKNNKKNLFIKISYRNCTFFKNYMEFADFNNSKEIQKKNLFYFNKLKDFDNYKKYKLSSFSIFFNSLKIIFVNFLINLRVTKVLFHDSYFKKNSRIIFCLKTFFYFNSIPNLKLENYRTKKKELFDNRLALISKYSSKQKDDLLLKNILFFMPINYLENFQNIFKIVEKVNLCDAIYVDGSEVTSDFIKFYIAKLRFNHKKIFTGQHSLRSGLDDFSAYFDYSKSISSNFLTWGWNSKVNLIKKFSSLRIFNSLKKYSKSLVVNNKNLGICFVLCGYSQMGECLYENFIENEKAEKTRIQLLTKIYDKYKKNIFLKKRTGSFILKNKTRFYKKFKILKDKTRMYEILGKYNLILFERLSLGIVECMYLNQPVIFYYPKNLYKFKNQHYKDLIMLLKKANILFENSKEIEIFLKEKKNISNWWLNKKNILNRKKVLAKYGKSFSYSDFEKFKRII